MKQQPLHYKSVFIDWGSKFQNWSALKAFNVEIIVINILKYIVFIIEIGVLIISLTIEATGGDVKIN